MNLKKDILLELLEGHLEKRFAIKLKNGKNRLPVPDSEPKKMKGGHRLRKMKERYAVTDMRKLANRTQFGVAEESSLVNGMGEGYGMLGQAGSSKIRVFVAQMKLAAKVAKKFKEKHYGSSDATSGRKSRLAFTPVQWLELGMATASLHNGYSQYSSNWIG
ncbi:hypothetical protein AB3S75_015762 [Citrus x aurantiifolia]